MSQKPTHIRERKKTSGRDLSYPPLPPALGVSVYDNHTHLDIADGDDPLSWQEQLDRASRSGVSGVVQVGCDLETSRWSAEHALRDERMLAAVAIHPNEAPVCAASGVLDSALEEIYELAARPRVVAVGETGLDFFRTGAEGHAAQYRSFEAHIVIAKENNRALQIHDRDAHREVVKTLKRVGAPERTVFHCFSGDAEFAELCASHGWYLSFAGNLTFANAGMLRDALRAVPRSQLLIETDAPFLTPVPYRGRPNAPYLLPHTLLAMADFLECDVSVLAAQLSANTERVYGSWNAEPVTSSSAHSDS